MFRRLESSSNPSKTYEALEHRGRDTQEYQFASCGGSGGRQSVRVGQFRNSKMQLWGFRDSSLWDFYVLGFIKVGITVYHLQDPTVLIFRVQWFGAVLGLGLTWTPTIDGADSRSQGNMAQLP